jgi:hypothetical protein
MIQVEVAPQRSKTSPPSRSLRPELVLNGELIEDSWAKQEDKRVRAYVYNMPAVTLLLECRLSEIVDHFSFLCLRTPEYLGNDLSSYMNIRRHEQYGVETLQFEFSPSIDLEHWAKPWSVADFSSIVTKIIEERHVSGIFYDRSIDSKSVHMRLVHSGGKR